jgi:hypothetical protein
LLRIYQTSVDLLRCECGARREVIACILAPAVARTCVVLLRAHDPADLDQLEEALTFGSEPLTEAPPLNDLPR